MVRRILILLLFALPNASATSLGPSEWGLLQKLQEDLQTKWRESFFTSSPSLQITIKKVPPKESKHRAAQTGGSLILINEQLPTQQFKDVLAHEISHQMLANACDGRFSPFEQEVFALWFSGDYIRLGKNAEEFAFLSEAKKHLNSRKANLDTSQSTVQKALSRLLFQKPLRDKVEKYFARRVVDCEFEDKELWSLISDWKESVTLGGVNILVRDSVSGDLIFRQGDVESEWPVGSTLKPLLVAMAPELEAERMSRSNIYWACPDRRPAGARVRWGWQDALAKSCNGFFLDSKINPDSWENWSEVMKNLDVKSYSKSVASAIGLVPNIQLSLHQMLNAYEVIQNQYPHIVSEALIRTPKIGTISSFPEAQWFERNGLAVKTGTTRSEDGKPLHAWVVVIGEHFQAVAHGQGHIPQSLVRELRDRLKDVVETDNRSVNVQILGLVPHESRKWKCPQGQAMVKDEFGAWSWKEGHAFQAFKENHEYRCLGGKVTVQFERQPGFLDERSYAGSLLFESQDQLQEPKSKLPLTLKQKRARRGSALTLRTSETHYVESVLASEFSNASFETLKALALVVRNNVHQKRHNERPLCDTTHCQVFGVNRYSDASFRRKVKQVVQEISKKDFKDQKGRPAQWLHFYLGGSKPWRKSLSSSQIQSRLDLPENPVKLKISNQRVFVQMASGAQKDFLCERVRSQLSLPACPTGVKKELNWSFYGRGEGHGVGLDLTAADLMARSGKSYRVILEKFYPKLELVDRVIR